MKRLYRWIFWLLLSKLTICLVDGEFMMLSGPEYKTGYFTYGNHQTRDIFCITDEIGSALTWNGNLDWTDPELVKSHEIVKPYVLPDDNYVYSSNENFTCQLSHTSNCSSYWERVGNHWSFATSLTKPMAPVFDNRWEDFQEERMTNRFKAITTIPTEGSLSVSIRGSTDAHFAICNGFDVSSFCFYVILGGWVNKQSVIRKCENGIPEPASVHPSGDCFTKLVVANATVLSSTEWKTFTIKWNFQRQIALSVHDSNGILLNYQVPKKMSYFQGHYRNSGGGEEYVLFARSPVKMLMKFHIYGFSLTTTTKAKLLSPSIIPTSLEGEVCVEMSVSLCDKCIMTVDFIDRDGQSRVAATIVNRNSSTWHGLPIWRNKRISRRLPADMFQKRPVQFQFSTLMVNATNNPYWAISNVRRCRNGALKVTKIKALQDYASNYFWPNITCQKISPDYSSKLIDSTDRRISSVKAEYRLLCPEGKVGRSCSVTCPKLFWNNDNCEKLMACDESGCSCAQGFMMPTCSEHCPTSMYGFECKRKCGHCAHGTCNFATGRCTDGCESADNVFYKPPYCQDGVRSPPAPIVDIINPTTVRVHLETKTVNEYKIMPTNVTFEIWANTSSPYYVSESIPIQNNTFAIEILNENLSPGINYRAVALVRVGNRIFRGESRNFTTPCTESAALNFVTNSYETSIILENRVDQQINDSCPYTWYHVQLFSPKDMVFDNVSTFPKIFSDLNPYTEYTLVIKSQKSTIVSNRIIKTAEGVPSPVRSLQAMSSTTDEIHFIWMSPEKPYGEIVNYTLEIEPLEFIGCKDINQSSYNSLKNTMNKLYHKEVIVKNVTQSTFNYTFHDLKPYTMYSITVYASNSKHEGDKAVSNYTTAEIKIPTEMFTNLHVSNDSTPTSVGTLWWNLPKDCSTITGPIRASKVFVRKLGKNFTEIKTKYLYYSLEESMFEGSETYEARVHVLRDFNELENKKTYANLTFTMPPRAPPSVNNVEIIEVNIQNETLTLRWEPPSPPLHGILDGYDIEACEIKSKSCHQNNSFFRKANQFCDLWTFNNKLCMTVPFPAANYELQVKARNINVTDASEPVIIPARRVEMTPTIPLDLSLSVTQREKASVNVSWSHPLIPGGRLTQFIIEAHLITTNLKVDPVNRILGILEVTDYQPRYSMELNLQPSSTFKITVAAMTFGQIVGNKAQDTITLPTIVNFNTTDLKGRTNNDLMIRIRIPEVKYDIKGSVMVVVVQGPRYCDEGESNNEDVKLFLDTQSSSYYKVAWKAATIMEPESWANKEFTIGDGERYGGSKNYLLCSKESYIVHLVLVENPKRLREKNYDSLGMSILRAVKTDAIHIGELPKNYAAWLTPLFLIMLIAALLLFVLYRKRLASRFMKNKTIVNGQENMPLANDFSKKKSNYSVDEVETSIKIMDTKDMPNNNIFIIEKKKEFIMPVKVEDFARYFESAFKSGQLKKEYSTITCGLTKPCAYGSQAETKPKNRYGNLYPYDDTRVILEKLDNDPYSDYINANFITGYGGKRKTYIATQGPKPNTVIDFWRMIWQEKVQIICMMANLMENGKVKCEQYWPSVVGKRVLYGKISVRFASEEVHCDYTYRTFQISCENEQGRMIEHLHYTAWPDHGVPSNPRSIVAFLKEIQRHAPMPRQQDDPPIVVHCSAGVGRTGTLIVLDMCLCRAFSEEVVDVYANVLSVREERLNMVDNTEQYLLVHLVLVEYFNSQDTCFECDKSLPERIVEAKKNSSLHYQRILDTSWWCEVLGSPPLPEKSLSNRNRMKHRFPESAGGLNRLYLKRSLISDEDSDYIAATCVRNLFKDRQYIATQLPMPSTSGDFWRMLAEQNVEVVLVLQSPDLQDPTYCELVPESQGFGNVKYLKVVRQENSTTDTKHYFKEEVFLIDSSEQPSKEQFVKILSFKKWPESSLPDPNELVELWKAFESFPKKDNCPIVIVCRNGITASGIWLTASFLLKRMTVDNECDVPQAVKAIRSCRKDFLNKPEYLEYLYDIALAWSREKLYH